MDSETVAETANALDSWLDVKAEQGYSKPIFVMSHVPLHLNGRKENGTSYDSRNAGYIVNALNEAGEKGLNIIYLFGHNHSNGYDGYIGGSCMFYAPGETMLVYNIGGTADSDFTATELHFTYMNPGYVGYVNTGEPGKTVSSSIFEIYEDRIVISRYSKSKMVNLKNQGVRSTNYKDNTVIYDAPVRPCCLCRLA